jgi:LmbE family N-acetylglucosaminyl deacetylase
MNNEARQVLVVMAHPDDPEFSCGGTLAKWTREGSEIRYVLLTCGDKGSDSPDVTPEMLCADRQVEQRAAAAVLGVKDVIFLSYHDGELVNSPEVRRDIVREIRRFRPDVVVTGDPTTYFRMNAYINHADHRAAGAATLDAVFPAAGNLMYFPELLRDGFEPHSPKEAWLTGSNEPNLWVDVTDTIATKIAALKEHKSQIQDPAAMEQRMRERLLRRDVDRELYAESFRVLKLS